MKRKTVLKALWVAVLCIVIAMSAVELSHRWDEYRSNKNQLENMRLAREHLPFLTKLIEADARFERVEVCEFSGSGGCILASGKVKSEQDLQALKGIVHSTRPPVTVKWNLYVPPPGRSD